MLSTPEKLVFALILAGAIVYFARRTLTLVHLIRIGKPDPDERSNGVARRLGNMLLDVFLQRKVLRKPVVGFLHLLIVWGFFVFAVNTINHFTGAFVPGFHLFGKSGLALYYTPIAEIFALLIITGVLGLAFRRYIQRPESLSRPSPESAIVFAFIGGAMAAYLWANATEIALGMVEYPDYHFASAVIARAFARLPRGPLLAMGHLAWWCDALMHLVLVALLVIPTKHLHLVAGPINLIFARTRPRGQMLRMNLEDENAESFGVSKIEDFTWKQNLDLYACIECGRCQDYCPTYHSGKPLRPKHLIVDLKHHLLSRAPALLNPSPAGETAESSKEPALIGDVVDVEAIWACTTCAACIEHCPMGIEHVDKLTDLRRHLVLMEAQFPEQADTTFRNMETAGNPWGFARADRAAWAQGLDVPRFGDKREAEVLWWVGCSGSYDDRSKKISAAMAKILKAAGVDFAILGEEERCNCESARRLGNEYLYQTAAQEIIETLKQYRFKTILTACPHCFNTFANEYPGFGALYAVVHHTQFIQRLIKEGRLPLDNKRLVSTVFHDSCYLGRYNEIFAAPRQALEAAGGRLVSAPRDGRHGFCCGAGGGRMWLEERIGEQISTLRARELLNTGAAQIAAACPFCITMLSDGVKKQPGADTPVLDVAEIVAAALRSSN